MLRVRATRLVATAMLSLVASCGGDIESEFSLKGTLDGASFDATGVTATIQNSVLTLSGATAQNLVRIRVLVPSTPGTLSFGTDTSAISFGDVANQTAIWSTIYGGTGTVTFTKTTPEETSGTFSFTARLTPGQNGSATRTISSGSFVAKF